MTVKVLDVGCGSNPRGDVNIDVNTTYLDGETEPNVLADGSLHLPFKDNSFLLVRSHHFVEHLEKPYAFVRELARVSKRWVYVACPNTDNLRWIALNTFGTIEDVGHYFRAFSLQELRQMFKMANLTVVKTAYGAFPGPRKLDIFFKQWPRVNMRELQILGQK